MQNLAQELVDGKYKVGTIIETDCGLEIVIISEHPLIILVSDGKEQRAYCYLPGTPEAVFQEIVLK